MRASWFVGENGLVLSGGGGGAVRKKKTGAGVKDTALYEALGARRRVLVCEERSVQGLSGFSHSRRYSVATEFSAPVARVATLYIPNRNTVVGSQKGSHATQRVSTYLAGRVGRVRGSDQESARDPIRGIIS